MARLYVQPGIRPLRGAAEIVTTSEWARVRAHQPLKSHARIGRKLRTAMYRRRSNFRPRHVTGSDMYFCATRSTRANLQPRKPVVCHPRQSQGSVDSRLGLRTCGLRRRCFSPLAVAVVRATHSSLKPHENAVCCVGRDAASGCSDRHHMPWRMNAAISGTAADKGSTPVGEHGRGVVGEADVRAARSLRHLDHPVVVCASRISLQGRPGMSGSSIRQRADGLVSLATLLKAPQSGGQQLHV